MSELKGYGTSDYVKNNYQVLRQLIATMKEGELVDLIGRAQVELGVKEDKAREYVFGALSSRWIEVSNNGRVIDTLWAKMNLKYLRHVHFRCLLGKMEKRFNVNTGSNEMMAEEEPPEEYAKMRELDMSSPTPFTDYANKDLKEINETRGNMGLPPLPFEPHKKR